MDQVKIEKYFSFPFNRNIFSRKSVFNYGFLLFVAIIASGMISMIGSGASFWTKSLQLIFFCFAGCCYVAALNTKKGLLIHIQKSLLLTLWVSGFIFFSLITLYLLLAVPLLIMALGSTCAFLLPYTIGQSWIPFNQINPTTHKLWHYSEMPASKIAILFLNSVPVQIKIEAMEDEDDSKIYSVVAPSMMKLGIVFTYFLQEQNENPDTQIHYKDEGNQPYSWEFYTVHKNGWNKKFLDPDLNLVDNNVRPNTIIRGKRLANEFAVAH